MSEDNNFKNPASGMDKYGEPRMKLAILLRDKVLNKLNIPWTIENGTLLGAWRNGRFIKHDDDFDIALFFDTSPIPQVPDILKKILRLLPAPYEARRVSSYADKIEVFDPSFGQYILLGPKYDGATYHHCTVDLQFYQRHGNTYTSLYYIQPNIVSVYLDDIYPLQTITLEGENFQAPFNVEGYLTSIYGSLSPKAQFNCETGYYEEKEEFNNNMMLSTHI